MTTIYTTQTLTSTGSIDSSKNYIIVDRAADVKADIELPDLTGLTTGSRFIVYRKDNFATDVQLNTFDAEQKMSGTDLSLLIGQYQTITVVAIDATYWALQQP